ncbi:disulfide bond formation protein B [Sulfitobacter sp. F26169L]|uniref:disulfide bond formation protein B n=1 Tax=Sulfitobacter sp. F26169L TaxID=2996015 RepID=UPI002260AAB6|nr:disulfide bond formation protein B [Sulfitobacter sp. F26169L]MCX7565302.1 disulfide bond formation protein B [Sulfitobacter sp. F26169L]
MIRFVYLAALGSAAVLLGAFAFQHLGGMPPCKLCLWQRWPHAAAALMGVIIILTGKARLAWLGAIASLTTAIIGFYHVGVEQGWWEGPTSCSSSGVSNLSAQDLMNQILAAPMVRCDDIAWQMLGISMAGWNVVASLALAALWIEAARRA